MVDDKYALFPYNLSSKGVTYAVLGFYSIVYAWGISFLIQHRFMLTTFLAEYETAKNELGRVIRYKFAFRWCEEQVSSPLVSYINPLTRKREFPGGGLPKRMVRSSRNSVVIIRRQALFLVRCLIVQSMSPGIYCGRRTCVGG